MHMYTVTVHTYKNENNPPPKNPKTKQHKANQKHSDKHVEENN